MSTKNWLSRWASPLMLLAVFFWAGAIVITKIAVTTVPPATIAFLRFASGAIVLLLLLWWSGKAEKIKTKYDFLLFFLLGLFSYFCYFIFINNGLRFTSATNSGLLTATYPIFAGILAYFFLKESFNGYKLLGLIIGVTGTVVLVSHGLNFTFSLSTIKGDLLVLAGVALGCFDPIISKTLVKRYRPLTILTYAMVCGSMLFLPFFIYELPLWQPTAISADIIMTIIYLALCPTIIGYLIWYSCLEFMDATHVALYTNLIPLATVILAVVFLHERLTVSTIAGSILVIGGMLCMQRGAEREKSSELGARGSEQKIKAES